jgi:hypothetical protein
LGVPAQKNSAAGLTRFNLLQEAGKRIFACIPHAGLAVRSKCKLRTLKRKTRVIETLSKLFLFAPQDK